MLGAWGGAGDTLPRYRALGRAGQGHPPGLARARFKVERQDESHLSRSRPRHRRLAAAVRQQAGSGYGFFLSFCPPPPPPPLTVRLTAPPPPPPPPPPARMAGDTLRVTTGVLTFRLTL